MQTPATRQDVQNAIDRSRSVIMGSMLSRGDLQSVVNQVRGALAQDIRGLHAENQGVMNQAANGRAQIMQRLGSLEASMARIDQSLHALMAQQSKTSSTIGKMQPDTGYLFQRV